MRADPSWNRAIDRVAQACDSNDDSRALRFAALDEIRRTVGFEGYAWVLTDPETEVGAAPLADAPFPLDAGPLIRLKYLTSINRWTNLDPPVGLLRATTDDTPERSPLWDGLLSRHGVNDVASVVFRDGHGCWGFLDLWRVDLGGRFTAPEGDFLRQITPMVTAALRRSQARTFDLEATAPERSGPIVLVLSPELEIKAQTPETEAYLRVLIPPSPDRPPIPAGAFHVAAQLIAVEAGVDDHPPLARVHFSEGLWLTLRAARIGGSRPVAEQDIAVTIEPTAPSERMTLFARACGLTARETELMTHLAAGANTRQVADQMFLSEHTVQDHLKSIFDKTGTRTRPALLTRALGR